MKGAMVVTWTAPITGREIKGLEVFAKANGWYEQLLREGRITGYRDYFSVTGRERGIVVVEGDVDELLALQAEPTSMEIRAEAQLVVNDLDIQVYAGGRTEDIAAPMEYYTQALAMVGVT